MPNGNGTAEAYAQWVKLIGIAFFAGITGNLGMNTLFPPAPDRFTGTEGRVLEARADRNTRDIKELRAEFQVHEAWSRDRREEIFRNDVTQTSLLQQIAKDQQEIKEDLGAMNQRIRALEKGVEGRNGR